MSGSIRCKFYLYYFKHIHVCVYVYKMSVNWVSSNTAQNVPFFIQTSLCMYTTTYMSIIHCKLQFNCLSILLSCFDVSMFMDYQ